MRYEDELADTAPAAQHAVHSERLREVMRRLDALSGDRLPREIDMRRALERQRRAVAALALALAKSAAQIPEIQAEVPLSDASREEFRRLAGDLERRSRSLAERAPELSAAAIQDELDGISASCDSCHRRFRVPPAPAPM